MYTLEAYNDEWYNFVIRKDGVAIIWVDAAPQFLHDLIGLANLGLARKDDDLMEPNYKKLAVPEPQSQVADSRGAAGLDGGSPFVATITTLPQRAHGCEEGCNCRKCAMIQEAYERAEVLHSETY